MARLKTKNILDYLLLLFIASVSLTLIIYFDGNRNLTKIIASIFACLYFIWGVFHQWKEKTLYWELVFEYALYAILGLLPVILLV